MAEASTVSTVEAWAISFALPHPLQLGDLRIDRRHYTVLRVTTADGTQGAAYGLTRAAPIDLLLTDVMAPLVVGQNALDIPSLSARWERVLVPLGNFGLVLRACSLLDIALWDIRAKAAGLPLWRMLGGARERVPVMLVDGYPRAGEDAERFGARMGARAAEGYGAIKIANLPGASVVEERLAAVRRAAGDGVELVVDIVWAWRDVRTGLASAALWQPHRLRWIEDPFVPDRVENISRLRAASPIPIASGDEVSNPAILDQLLDQRAVDVLRLDATTAGGVSGFSRVVARAATAGIPISPHVYPELHQHFAFAWPNIEPVEMFPRGGDFDFIDRFVTASSLNFESPGTLLAPQAPGIGMDIDWKAVEAASTRHSRVAG